MSWNTAKHCLFTAALFRPPTPWLDEELEEMAAECASQINCGAIRQQVAGLAANLGEREADYARLFLSKAEQALAHPHSSYWLERQGGGDTGREAAARMSRYGVSPTGGRMADSLAAELEFLAWLLQEGALSDARWLVNHHLRMWIPGFLEAIRNADPHPFYRGAADMLAATLEVVHSELTPEPQLAQGF